MAKVKGIISIPEEVCNAVVITIAAIDAKPALITQAPGCKKIIYREDIQTDDGLNVFVTLHGQSGLYITMDVYVENIKLNSSPILAVYQGGGNYVINYNA